MHVSAKARVPENVEVLKNNPAFANRAAMDLEKLAYLRGMLQEGVRNQP